MRCLGGFSLAKHFAPKPEAPEPAPNAIRSPEQLGALRSVVVIARRLARVIVARRPQQITADDLAQLGRALDWLDSTRLHEAPVEQPADAAALWAVADACKMLLPQLREMLRAAEVRDTVGVERWAGYASVSLGLLGVALDGCAP